MQTYEKSNIHTICAVSIHWFTTVVLLMGEEKYRLFQKSCSKRFCCSDESSVSLMRKKQQVLFNLRTYESFNGVNDVPAVEANIYSTVTSADIWTASHLPAPPTPQTLSFGSSRKRNDTLTAKSKCRLSAKN